MKRRFYPHDLTAGLDGAFDGPRMRSSAADKIARLRDRWRQLGGVQTPVLRAAVLASLLLTGAVQAQTLNQATLNWTAPTTYTDGTPIAAGTLVTYNVYQGPSGTIKVKTPSSPLSVASVTITTGFVTGTVWCFQVSSIANGLESALSAEACKTFPFPPPSAPTGLKVQ
jgi:hypothetical protein